MAEEMMEGIPVVNDPKYGCLANFKIDKKIGKGQFSEVWRAVCTVDETVVALKKVQVGKSKNENKKKQKKKEK